GFRHPLAAVPLGDAAVATALVVLSRDGERREQTFGSEVLDLFQALLQLFCGQRLTLLFERVPNALDDDGHAGDADVVIAAADVFLVTRSFSFGVNLVEYGLDHRIIAPVGHALEAQHALGCFVADDLGIGFRQPDNGQQMIELDPVPDGIAQRHGLATARAPDHDPIGTIAANGGPGGGLLITRRWVEKRLQLEAFLVAHSLEDRN